MKRKTSSVPNKVYRYGALPPDDREVIDEQIWLAHRYYNDLIEVEHARRQAYVWARDKVSPEKLKEVAKQLAEERKDICNARVRDPDWGPGLRGTCGLYSGTYLMVEAQAEQASKAAIEALQKWRKKPKGKRGKRPNGLPSFRRWDGGGGIGIQCATPIPVSELMNGSNRYAQIDTKPRYHRRTGRIIKNGVTLRCVVGPGGKKASFPLKLHRPLPSDGLIRWIKITRRPTQDTRMGGVREKWEVHFTVESSTFIRPEREGPVAAIDLCWSRGRVGHLLGEDGYEEPVMPVREILQKLHYADSVQAIRATYRNVAKELAAMTIDPRVRSWPRMKSKGLRRKVRQWKGEGHDVAALEAWVRRDMHLHQIEHNVRAKAKRRLQNDYRVWARKTVDRYPVIVLEKIDLSEMAEKNSGGQKGNATRFAYAPSHLRDALKNAGAKIITIPAPYTSMLCHDCGTKISGTYHTPKCGGCGWTGDRRENAVRNILARGLEKIGRPGPPAGSGNTSKPAPPSTAAQRLRS